MSRFKKFPRKDGKKKERKSGGLGAAGDALETIIALSTLGLLEPPQTKKHKKGK